ncbi:toll-like receptor 1 [Protopterus annectens]|uniref:toll-like receptor 1 n=1 Tax=Protopterus annectens TaxID=7888 RepID=UPI001CF9677A|nr:toll-like receptor 1 [Protopterus annectens]
MASNIIKIIICILLLKFCNSIVMPDGKHIKSYASMGLTSVPRNMSTEIQMLDMSHNQISEIHRLDFQPLMRMTFLNLSFNLIKVIPAEVFQFNTDLTYLDLSNNLLHNTECSFLRYTVALTYLDISYNKYEIMILGEEFLSLPRLNFLGLSTANLSKHNLEFKSPLEIDTVFLGLDNIIVYEYRSLKGLKSKKLHISLPKNESMARTIVTDAILSSLSLELSNVLFTSGNNIYHEKETPFLKNQKLSSLILNNLMLTWTSFLGMLKDIWSSSLISLFINNITIIGKVEQLNFTYNDTSLKALTLKKVRFTIVYMDHVYLTTLFINMNIQNLSVTEAPMVFMNCPTYNSTLHFLDLSNNVLSDQASQVCPNFPVLESIILRGNKFKQISKVSKMTKMMKALKHFDVSGSQLHYDGGPEECGWLESLVKLNMSFNNLQHTVFKCLPEKVEILDLQYNKITYIPRNLVHLTCLKQLYIGFNHLSSLPGCSDFKNIELLVVENNLLHSISSEIFKDCNNLTILNARNNPYQCTCDLYNFISHSNRLDMKLVGWPDMYKCKYPDVFNGTGLKDFSLPELSCNIPLLVITVLIIAFAFTFSMLALCRYLDLPWYFRMVWQWTQTKRRVLKKKSSQLLPDMKFHAFVSYSQLDSDWVKEYLIPNLEKGDKPLRICQHQRDFIAGKSIIENIINCIEKSYKSIFVLSSNFIKSEWCHYELYFAHHKLFSENADNLILILLEPIPQYTIPAKYYRLKGLMAKRTYLEWPKNKIKHGLFWANLRAVIDISLPETEMVTCV